jgi:hypothetical protein
MYVKLPDVKTFLWISDPNQDIKIDSMIDIAQAITTNIIWDVEYWEKTEQITCCDFVYWRIGLEILLKNINIDEIVSINWIAYTGALGTNYRILPPNNSKVRFDWISQYTWNVTWKYFDIVYNAWYEVIPSDIKYLQYLLIGWMISNENWKPIKSYVVWDVEVVFALESLNTWVMTINSILSKYKKFVI